MEISLEDKKTEPTEGFIRQRRNLVITSSLVIFIHHAEVTMLKKGKLLGFSFDIGNPEIINTFIAVLLCYFAWRFYQYSFGYAGLKNLFKMTGTSLGHQTNIHLTDIANQNENENEHSPRKSKNFVRYKDAIRHGFYYKIEIDPDVSTLLGKKTESVRVSIITLQTKRLFWCVSNVLVDSDISDSLIPYFVFLYALYLVKTSDGLLLLTL